MALRWGILSTANITDKLLDSGTDQEFVAVASRDAARAEAYAREKGIALAVLWTAPKPQKIYDPQPVVVQMIDERPTPAPVMCRNCSRLSRRCGPA